MDLTPGCVTDATLFHRLEVTADDPALLAKASAICGRCPLAAQCLYDAVVRHEVAGFVAGSTPAQRRTIRARVGARLEADDFDTWAGVVAGGRPVDRAEVLRLRRANPDETLEQLALRLGCSTSTVKRHLRKVRAGVMNGRPERRVPTRAEVLDAARMVLGRRFADAA